MPKLVAEITAETSGLETGLRRADGMVEKFGEKVKHHLMRSFGYGMLATAVTHGITHAIERAEQISEGAAKLKITTDEYQGLEAAAKKASLSVDEFVERNKKNGVVLEQQIINLGKYKDQVKMTREEIEQFKEMKAGGSAFLSGITGTSSGIAQKLFNLIAGVGNLAMASASTLFGRGELGGVKTEDYLVEAMRQGAQYRGGGAEWREGSDSSALDLPAATRLKRRQKAMGKLQTHLDSLVAEEKDTRQKSDRRMEWLGAGVTDWQAMGAMTRTPSVLVSDQQQQHQEQIDKLEGIRKEIADTKAAIEKLNRGE